MSKIENRALFDLVYERIKDMIDEGVIQPGEKINKGELAEKLGVSQTPINEALSKLAGEKFLEQRSRQGFFLQQYTYRELRHLFELRASIEGMAARLCVEQVSDEDLMQITSVFDGFSLPFTEDRLKDYLHVDKLFHESLVKYSGNSFLVEFAATSGYLIKSNQKGLVRVAEETLPEHKEMINALRSRDAHLAQELAIMHLLKSRDKLKEIENTGHTLGL